ncbi:uncharacterized protein [Palaemon carinicauda]|uniref:uncharacterized protein n=1 Tax=Palaemon carinicauda TaxID=392227 RepID=UPI0035B5A24F
MHRCLKNLDWENVGININVEYLDNLSFSDDIVPFRESWMELQNVIEDLNRESKNVRLQMNMSKTELCSMKMLRDNKEKYLIRWTYLYPLLSHTKAIEHKQVTTQRAVERIIMGLLKRDNKSNMDMKAN